MNLSNDNHKRSNQLGLPEKQTGDLYDTTRLLTDSPAPKLKIVFKFESGPCSETLFGVDVEHNTTITVLKSIIKNQSATRCKIPDNVDIQLQIYGLPDQIIHDNDFVGKFSGIENPPRPMNVKKGLQIVCDIAFDVKLIEAYYHGGRKSRAKSHRRNSKKNKRTRRKSVKKQQRRRK
jgi:hypothetical protein